MKTEIKAGDWTSGRRMYEIPYVNGQIHGLVRWWHDDGSLKYLAKWHQGQVVWQIEFPSEEQIPTDAEVELFFTQYLNFHETRNKNRKLSQWAKET